MTTVTHIKFDGIDGESSHKDHKGEVEVLAWSWGLTSAAGAATGAGKGKGKGKVLPQELRIVHRYDKASPILARHAVLGKHVPSAVLTARKAGEGQKDYIKIDMEEVMITSIQVSEGGEGPTEEVAMSYGRIDFEYRPEDASGNMGSPVEFGWNIKSNKVT